MACLHGLLVKSGEQFAQAPITLVPSSFPKEAYNLAVELQSLYNTLYHRVSRDHEFLSRHIPQAAEGDPFTARLWKIYSECRREGFAQPVTLALNRSDYMLSGGSLKQVEINLMASSFGGLSQRLSDVHRLVLLAAGRSERELAKRMPENRPAEAFGEAFAHAWRLYGQAEATIVFVVSAEEANAFDQRSQELEIYRADARIPQVLRRTFDQLADTATLADDRRLILDGEREVAIVYFRAGYSPKHFDGRAWETKLLLERSCAVKCPNIAYMLANTKIVQAALCEPGTVARYLPGKSAKLEGTFADQCPLSAARARRWVEAQGPELVLKPQREGGGNNFYGADILPFVRGLSDREFGSYIVMQRLRPPMQTALMLKNKERVARDRDMPLCVSAISELGIYGALVARNNSEKLNCSAGYTLRTKPAFVNEGGINSGHSCLDTVWLS